MIKRCIGQQGSSHAILALNSDLLLVQNFKDLLLDLPRIAHRLDVIIEHHTNIHTHIFIAYNYIYIRTVRQTYETVSKNILKMFYTLLRTHRRKKHANRGYGEKDISTDRFTFKKKL